MAAEVPMNVDNNVSQKIYYGVSGVNGYVPVPVSGSIAKVYPNIAWESNSGETGSKPVDDNCIAKNEFNSIRQFILLEQSFLQQLEKFPEIFDGQNKYALQEKIKLSADAILNCLPDRVSLELTHDGSIFYTFFKDNSTIYFEHFLIDEFDDSDESIITIFQADESVLSYGGSLVDSLHELNNFLMPQSTATLELA